MTVEATAWWSTFLYAFTSMCCCAASYSTTIHRSGRKAREHLSCECGHKVDVEGEGFTFK